MPDAADSATDELRPSLLALVRPSRHLLLDLGSSYAVNISRVVAAAIVVGILYRYTTPDFVAVFVLARAMLAGLNLLFSGVGPATLIELNRTDRFSNVPQMVVPVEETVVPVAGPIPLDYATPRRPAAMPAFLKPTSLYANLFGAALAAGLVALVGVGIYASQFSTVHRIPATKLADASGFFVFWLAFGYLGRVLSDPAGASLQSRDLLWVDNLIGIAGEVIWVLCAFASIQYRYTAILLDIGGAYAFSGLVVLILRALIAPRVPRVSYVELSAAQKRWARASVMIAVGSLADLLYGTASVVIINQLLSPATLAEYGPALQIDSALLLGVGAISAVLLPRASRAWANADLRKLRRIYGASMLVGVGLLIAGAAIVLSVRDTLLTHWLGTLPPTTRAILPLVLIHTVIGGTAGIGRAMLIAMNQLRVYTTSALVCGLLNVTLAITFVAGVGLGLRGVVYATIISVTVRCALWMPWHILGTLRSGPLSHPPAQSPTG